MNKRAIQAFLVIISIVMLIIQHHSFAKDYLNNFTDVPLKEWYADSVDFVHKNGLMNGTTKTTFEPESNITRGMIVTILYRFDGSGKVSKESTFSDVRKTDYYYIPVVWATQNGVVNGYSKEIFAPNDQITREQLATILYRYVKLKKHDIVVDEENFDLMQFEDRGKISHYALDAIIWANTVGLINGVTNKTLEPQGNATRAQAATIFTRLDNLFEKIEKSSEDIMASEDSEKSNNQENKNGSNTNSDKNIAEEIKVESEKDEITDKIKNEELKSPTIYIDDARISGKYADVVISIINNPGIASIKFDVKFDDENLKLVSVDYDSMWGDYITAPTPYRSPQTISLISPFENIAEDGRFATLRFEIVDDSYDKNIIIECDNNNTFDSDFNDVEFYVINGKLTKNKE